MSHPPLRRVGGSVRVDPTLRVSRNEDSCYSSCSEESHSSLSRESSDAMCSDFDRMRVDGHPEPFSSSVTPVPPLEKDILRGTASTISNDSGYPSSLWDGPGSPSPFSSLPAGSHYSLNSLVSSSRDDGSGGSSNSTPRQDDVEFATQLGYSAAQCASARASIGESAGQDRLLAELLKLGRAGVRGGATGGGATSTPSKPQLRSVVIDGSNIAMTHGRKTGFSCAGIRDCVRFFQQRGHTDIVVFVPHYRREAARADCPIIDQHILEELEQEGILVWTPSRRVNGRRIVCHDDRYILKTAEEKDAVIVSNDEYRDLVRESPQLRRLVENRLLMYSFVDGKFMPPDDPLGRHGPSLTAFLSAGGVAAPATAQLCPYGKKCTYGNKCKYSHPERPNGMHVSVTERLMKERTGNGGRRSQLAARPSMVYESGIPLTHQQVARTRSLNNPMMGQENRLPAFFLPEQHSPLFRQQSGPGGCTSTNHLFAPSTAIWGQSALSVGPVGATTHHTGSVEMDASTPEGKRAQLRYHLQSLFKEDEQSVREVMAAHPEESNVENLFKLIIAHKAFKSST